MTVPGGIASTTTQTDDRAGNVRTNGRNAVGPALAEQLTNGYNSLSQATSLNGVAGGVTSNYVADTSLLEGCAIDHGGLKRSAQQALRISPMVSSSRVFVEGDR